MLKPECLFFIIIFIFSLSPAFSQAAREESSLNYTYLGPVITAAYSSAEYSDWINNSRSTEKTSGMSYALGADLQIIAGGFCGDFQFKYSYSQLDMTVTCLDFIISGKYLYAFNPGISAGGGIGLYLESPPSNQDHNGSAGLCFPVTAMFIISPETRFFTDVFFKYGSFGIGNDTTFSSIGCNLGFVYKVGRI